MASDSRTKDARLFCANAPRKLHDELRMQRFLSYESAKNVVNNSALRQSSTLPSPAKIGQWNLSKDDKPVKVADEFSCAAINAPMYPIFPVPNTSADSTPAPGTNSESRSIHLPRKLGQILDAPYKHHSYSIRHKGSKIRVSLSAPSLGRKSKHPNYTTKLRSMMQNANPTPCRARSLDKTEPVFVQTLRAKEQQLVHGNKEYFEWKGKTNNDPSFLPLELFDDAEKFEKVRPKDWLPSKASDPKDAVNGCSRWFYPDGTWIWQPCSVMQYDKEVDRFLIEWLHNGKRKFVPRLNLRFEQDDPASFAERLEHASSMRDITENRMRYNMQLESFQDARATGPPTIFPSELMSNILVRSNVDITKPPSPANSQLLMRLSNEIQASYKRSIDCMHLDTLTAFHNRKGGVTGLTSALPMPPPTPSAYRLALSINDDMNSVQNLKTALAIPEHNFSQNRRNVAQNLTLANKHIVPAMHTVMEEIIRLGSIDFLCGMGSAEASSPKESYESVPTQGSAVFSPRYGYKPLPLLDFQKKQSQQIQDTVSIIRDRSAKLIQDVVLDAYTDECESIAEASLKHLSKALFYKMICKINLIRRHALEVCTMKAVSQYVRMFEQFVDSIDAKFVEPIVVFFSESDSSICSDDGNMSSNISGDFDFPFGSKTEPSPRSQAENLDSQQNGEVSDTDSEAGPEESTIEQLSKYQKLLLSRADQAKPFVKSVLYRHEHSLIIDRTSVPCPIFRVTLTAHGDKLVFDPPLEQFEVAAVAMLAHLSAEVRNLEPVDLIAVHKDDDSGPPQLPSHPALEQYKTTFAQAQKRIQCSIRANFAAPQALAQVLSQHDRFLRINPSKYLAEFCSQNHPMSRCTDEIKSHQAAAQEIETQVPDVLELHLFAVDCTALKEALVSKARNLATKLLEWIASNMRAECMAVDKQSSSYASELTMKPESIEAFGILSKTLEVVTGTMSNIKARIANIRTHMGALETCKFLLPDADSKDLWEVFSWPKRLHIACEATTSMLPYFVTSFETQLLDQKEAFKGDLNTYVTSVEAIVRYGMDDWEACAEIANKIQIVQQSIDDAEEQAVLINSREAILEWQETTYDQIADLQDDARPCGTLWNLVSYWDQNYHQWMDGPFRKLNRDSIQTRVHGDITRLREVEAHFENKKCFGPQGVAVHLRKNYEDFKKFLPLIYDLRNPGLRPRHWALLTEEMGFELTGGATVTLRFLLEQGNAMQYVTQIADISEIATQEHELEIALNKMEEEWSEQKGKTQMQLKFVEWRDTQNPIITDSDEVLEALEDHISRSQSMHNSPYVSPFEDRLDAWIAALTLVQDTLDEWLATQTLWQYLKPIFESDDIMRQMPLLGRQFKDMDAAWRLQTTELSLCPFVMQLSNSTEAHDMFKEWRITLENIMFHLNEYLDMKRHAFPRFFFLSNDELLEILSHTKDPLSVQMHLPKLFDGINRLQFDERSPLLRISAMRSSCGECISFLKPVCPMNDANSGKFVEVWLTHVEWAMRQALHQEMRTAIAARVWLSRIDWVLQCPGQVALALSQMFWTMEVEEALSWDAGKGENAHGAEVRAADSGPGGLRACNDAQSEHLEELLQRVRGPLSRIQRITLGALVVLDVHARDIVARMCELEVSDFEWSSQLRFYWDETAAAAKMHAIEKGAKEKGKDGRLAGGSPLEARMLGCSQAYCYEYLGNTTRLVVTPLTDRCYRTLMLAMHLHYGGAPEGPAGTGKTETVKDLAKTVGNKCVVFNCSDSLDYIAIGKFFKGLAGCGAWACFDEFNRINLDVLSVIAQQVSTLQTGSALDTEVDRIQFEGESISFKKSCAVFITMNPGYSGRTELPDNLKALFRPIAMMVPDYAMIAEISLYSYGFNTARSLAVKLTQSLSLASEQVSSQDHYDFGMRAVKSCIIAAGAFKLRLPTASEDVLVLQAIHDCNVPKFTQPDISLFRDITADLFPSVALLPDTDDWLSVALTDACKENNLQPVPAFLEKCQQLLGTLSVRHGVMLVGGIFAGKTSCYRILARALTSVSQQETSESPPPTAPVSVHVINPKAQTLGELYGDFDKATHEWCDGVLGNGLRAFASGQGQASKWLVLDGPVDAIWIENMNTVLDDNKKLCLNSGEIIKLTESMSMMFEVEDLAVASPATVSRCGMVFTDPGRLGWWPLVHSWLNSMPSALQPYKEVVIELVTWLVPKSLQVVRRQCKELQSTTDTWLVHSLLELFDSLLGDFKEVASQEVKRRMQQQSVGTKSVSKVEKGSKGAVVPSPGALGQKNQLAADKKSRRALKLTKKEIEDMSKPKVASLTETEGRLQVECCFIFALIWSVGASTDAASRTVFSLFLQEELNRPFTVAQTNYNGKTLIMPFPLESSVYDYQFDMELRQWTKWVTGKGAQSIPDNTAYNEVIVATGESIRNSFVMRTLVEHGKAVLFLGPTGTGKTLSVKSTLADLDPTRFSDFPLALSIQMTANDLQNVIEGRLEKRRKGILGGAGGKQLVTFIDDMGMCQVDAYGAHGPVELLRQWHDHGGWYEHGTRGTPFRRLVDLKFVGAMCPSNGGQPPLTKRFLRHFNLVSCPPFTVEILSAIFGKILEWGFRKFEKPIRKSRHKLVATSIFVYEQCAAVIRPTPSKPLYKFNLRDLSRVIEGVLSIGPKTVSSKGDILRVWVHECNRVFADRMVGEDDQSEFGLIVRAAVDTHADVSYDEVVGDAPLLYGNFVAQESSRRVYRQIRSYDALRTTVEKCVTDLAGDVNSMQGSSAHSNDSFVAFNHAIDHIARIARVLQFARGHMLLVGVTGCGRQTAVKIATQLVNGTSLELAVSKEYTASRWRESLGDVLLSAGVGGKTAVLLFSDSEVHDLAMLGDLCTILSGGDFSKWFTQDQQDKATGMLYKTVMRKNKGTKPSNEDVFKIFLSECRKHLHIVFRLSATGDTLRTYVRDFPALLNCCSVDWVQDWPDTAKHSVALQSFTTMDIHVEPDKLKVVFSMLHNTAASYADQYFRDCNRRFHITPGRYLQLLECFRMVMDKEGARLVSEVKKYETGCRILAQTEVAVQGMQDEIDALKPFLEVKTQETEALMVTVEESIKEADKTRESVAAEKAKAQGKKEEAQVIKDECSAELAKALPALDDAIQALKTLKKSDMDELKSLPKPPENIKLVLESVCIMLEEKPKRVDAPRRVDDPHSKPRKINDYWDAAKKLLANPKQLLQRLEQYDKDNIPAPVVKTIRDQYMTNPRFEPSVIAAASKACEGMCKWVRAMCLYDSVSKDVRPRRIALNEAEQILETSLQILAAKQRELQQAEQATDALRQKFEKAEKEKQSLEEQTAQCIQRKQHAEELLERLADEKVRWSAASKDLTKAYNNILGDAILAGAFMTYLGFFSSAYRTKILADWTEAVHACNLPCSPIFDEQKILGEPLTINRWIAEGLPGDRFSIANGLIAVEGMGSKYPLLIDPQGQASRWVRCMETQHGLRIAHPSAKRFADTLRQSVSAGLPLLLENLAGPFDRVLRPLLLKQTSTAGAGNRQTVIIDDAVVRLHPNFRLYLATNLNDPMLPAEDSVMVSFVNFAITPDGLEDQLQGTITHAERPQDAKERDTLIKQTASYREELQATEKRVLYLLSNSTGNLLDDLELIMALNESKQKSEEIAKALRSAEDTEKRVARTMELYRPLAARGSQLYFCTANLAQIEPFYQFSLKWVTGIFVECVVESGRILVETTKTKSREVKDVKNRVASLVRMITETLFKRVCLSLFERDKLLYSFLICLRVLQSDGEVTPDEQRFLLTGIVSPGKGQGQPNPAGEWLTKRMWIELQQLSQLPAFKGLATAISGAPDAWRKVYESVDAMIVQLPCGYEIRVSKFQRLLLLRCLRPDKMKVPAIQNFVSERLGRQFIEPQPFDLEACYNESECCKPLLFVLTPGQDPAQQLRGFVKAQRQRMASISLGQGQEKRAVEAIEYAHDSGTWALLQNCHLVPTWLPQLEKIVSELSPERASPKFRLWLTSAPTKVFPVLLLQVALKMVNEAPQGLRANLARSYRSLNQGTLDMCPNQPRAWRKLVFGLCFFHAVVQERRKFGPLGWVVPYGFSDADLRVSMEYMADQLEKVLDTSKEDSEINPNLSVDLPFESITHVTSELNYGGRVTDERDRRLLRHTLSDFLCPAILKDGHKFSSSGVYYAPTDGDFDSYFDFISQLPINDHPEAFGLHENAEFSLSVRETYGLLAKAQSLQQYGGSDLSRQREEVVAATAKTFLHRLPPNFDVVAVFQQYPQTYDDSMNTVLTNEIKRYNGLLSLVRGSLEDVQRALKGLITVSQTVEQTLTSMYEGAVPQSWVARAYPSQKPLMSWVEDLMVRLQFFSAWIRDGAPDVFWISGFFFTHSFTTGVMQNHARHKALPIDRLEFSFRVISSSLEIKHDNDGVYVNGFFLECARWDEAGEVLGESYPKQMASVVPVIWFKPCTKSTILRNDPGTSQNVYQCPVYRESSRNGKLLTTGHSTNFLLMIGLPSDRPEQHWIKRGVAMLCQLDD